VSHNHGRTNPHQFYTTNSHNTLDPWYWVPTCQLVTLVSNRKSRWKARKGKKIFEVLLMEVQNSHIWIIWKLWKVNTGVLWTLTDYMQAFSMTQLSNQWPDNVSTLVITPAANILLMLLCFPFLTRPQANWGLQGSFVVFIYITYMHALLPTYKATYVPEPCNLWFSHIHPLKYYL